LKPQALAVQNVRSTANLPFTKVTLLANKLL